MSHGLLDLGDRYWALGLPAAAKSALQRALAQGDDAAPAFKLTDIALAQGDAQAAVREFRAEGAMGDWPQGTRARLGDAYAALHDWGRAAGAWRAELRADPANTEARDSLAALEARGR